MNRSKGSVCGSKRRHPTLAGARIALRKTIEEKDDLALTMYRCKFCKGWHIGHPPKCEQRRLGAKRLVELIDKAMRS